MKNAIEKTGTQRPSVVEVAETSVKQRQFLKYAGAGAAAAALVALGCKKDDPGPDMSGNEFYFGSGDIAILNYAYALEQLEAAFYTEVVTNPSGSISDWERTLMMDIRDHEIAHLEFFKAALGQQAIASLKFAFSSINFSKSKSVMATDKKFKDPRV